MAQDVAVTRPAEQTPDALRATLADRMAVLLGELVVVIDG